MNKSRKIVLRLFLIFIAIACSACSRNSMVYEMTPSPTSVFMVNEVGDDSKKDEDDVVDKTANLDFNRFDWDGAQVPTDIRKSFMNSKKL